MQSLFNSFSTIAAIAAQVKETLLVLMRSALDALDRWLTASILHQICGRNHLIQLQCMDEHPNRWMALSNEAGKGVIPALADVVGPFLPGYYGVVHVPECWRKQRRRST